MSKSQNPSNLSIIKAGNMKNHQDSTNKIYDNDNSMFNVINANEAWMIEQPRSIFEIVTSLFPGMISRVKDILLVEPEVSEALGLAGFAPIYTPGTAYCSMGWHKAIPQFALVNSPNERCA